MTLEEMDINEVLCSECGKPISVIPRWLSNVKAKFQCEECRQKHPRIPGLADAEPRRMAVETDDFLEIGSVVQEAEEDEEIVDEETAEEETAEEYA